MPANHRAEESVEAYVDAEDAKAPFVSERRPGGLAERATTGAPRRPGHDPCAGHPAAGLPQSRCCHTFRATGVTAYLSNGGTLEHAQRIAGHASLKTTKLYDRTADTISLDEIEGIIIGLCLA